MKPNRIPFGRTTTRWSVLCFVAATALGLVPSASAKTHLKISAIGAAIDGYENWTSSGPWSDIQSFKNANASRPVVDLVLELQALKAGGLDFDFELVRTATHELAQEQVIDGHADLAAETTWSDEIDANSDKLLKTDAVIRDGEFVKGIYVMPSDQEHLKISSLDDLRGCVGAVVSTWSHDARCVDGMKLKGVVRTVTPEIAFLQIQRHAADFTLAEFSSNPDLHVVVPNGTMSLIVTGSAQSVRAAKELIAELDVIPQSVVLDTEILELDESSSRNLGLQLGTTSIGTTFSEVQPTPDPNTGQAGRLIQLQPLTRTGISFQAQVNLLIQNGKARVLADPRITTISGRTATIRAGDSISILTTVGGGSGTVATTQLQTFQTGVNLDITPIVTSNGEVSVALHPVVNSLSGFLNNVPQISTRDTQTQVHLRDNETLVIGGLIQESSQAQESKIPLLGDLPFFGRAFRNQTTTNTRNELIIVVTPHVLHGSTTTTIPGAAGPPGMVIPSARPLPTLPPNTAFPTAAPATPVPAATGAARSTQKGATPGATPSAAA